MVPQARPTNRQSVNNFKTRDIPITPRYRTTHITLMTTPHSFPQTIEKESVRSRSLHQTKNCRSHVQSRYDIHERDQNVHSFAPEASSYVTMVGTVQTRRVHQTKSCHDSGLFASECLHPAIYASSISPHKAKCNQ